MGVMGVVEVEGVKVGVEGRVMGMGMEKGMGMGVGVEEVEGGREEGERSAR